MTPEQRARAEQFINQFVQAGIPESELRFRIESMVSRDESDQFIIDAITQTFGLAANPPSIIPPVGAPLAGTEGFSPTQNFDPLDVSVPSGETLVVTPNPVDPATVGGAGDGDPQFNFGATGGERIIVGEFTTTNTGAGPQSAVVSYDGVNFFIDGRPASPTSAADQDLISQASRVISGQDQLPGSGGGGSAAGSVTARDQFAADLERELLANRQAFEAQQAALTQGFQSGENALDRSFTQTENNAQRQQQADQFAATFEQQIREFEVQLRENNRQYGIQLEQLSLDRDRLALADAQGRRQDAIALSNIVISQETSLNRTRVELAAMSQQAQQFNATLAQNAQLFEASQTFDAAQSAANRAVQLSIATDQMLARNIDQQIAIAGQIADFSREPTDIVANIAALTQFGSIGTALSEGFNGLTDMALQPLGRAFEAQDTALTEQERLRAKAEMLDEAVQRSLDPNLGVTELGDPQTVNTDFAALLAEIQANTSDPASLFQSILSSTPEAQISEIDPRLAEMMNIEPGEAPTAPEAVITGIEPTVAPSVAPQAPEVSTAPPAIVPDSVQDAIDLVQLGGTGAKAGSTVGVGAPEGATQEDILAIFRASLGMADGGTTDANHILVGEEGPELLVKNPDGSITIIPNDEIDEAADGGIIQNPEVPLVDTERARNFLLEALRIAAGRFGNAAPNIGTNAQGIPSPVNVAAPGTDPLLQDAAAGLAASGAGVPLSLFRREIQRITPRGVNAGRARRTA